MKAPTLTEGTILEVAAAWGYSDADLRDMVNAHVNVDNMGTISTIELKSGELNDLESKTLNLLRKDVGYFEDRIQEIRDEVAHKTEDEKARAELQVGQIQSNGLKRAQDALSARENMAKKLNPNRSITITLETDKKKEGILSAEQERNMRLGFTLFAKNGMKKHEIEALLMKTIKNKYAEKAIKTLMDEAMKVGLEISTTKNLPGS